MKRREFITFTSACVATEQHCVKILLANMRWIKTKRDKQNEFV